MHKDMTEGKPTKLILTFALPMLIGNIFQQFYNVVDTIVVGRFVGKNALAAVGSSFAMMVFVTSILIGLCMGAGTVISQFYGAKDYVQLKRAISTSFIFIGGITLVLTLVTFCLTDTLLVLFKMPEEIFGDARIYLKFIFGGLIFVFLYNGISCLLRAIGDSKTPLYFLIVSAILNVVLDLVFVLVFDLGVAGVALATVIAQGTSALLSLGYAIKKVSFLKMKPSEIVFDKVLFKSISQYAVLTCIQQSIMNFGILMVQGLVNTFGATAMAAFAAGAKIDAFAYMPVQDFGNAFSTYIAQNAGAGKVERVKEGVHAAIRTIIVFCIGMSGAILFFSRHLMLIFINAEETEVIALGVEYISVVGIFYVLIGFLFMFYGFYRGVGYLNMSIILTVASLGTRVVLAYLLAATPLGIRGIWWSIPLGWLLADMIGFYVYRKGSWRKHIVAIDT